MAYTAPITTMCPTAFLVMVDQSGSMAEPVIWNGRYLKKSEAVALVINSILAEIIARTKGDDTYRHYFDIAVIGYGGGGVESLLPADESWFMTPAQLAGSVRRKEELQKERVLPDGRKILTKTVQKIWVESHAEGTTPMLAAFAKAYELVRLWCADMAKTGICFPPTIINISDGEATDGDLGAVSAAAAKLKGLSTGDGNSLLINVHVGGDGNRSIVFPVSENDLPEDRYARLLYNISSEMPEGYAVQIRELLETEPEAAGNFRGMAYNATIADLITLMNIGSTSVNLMR